MRYPKRSGYGFAERLELVRSVFDGIADEVRNIIPVKMAADDDILDSLAALWTAKRIHAGTASRLPEFEERDTCGLPMQMLA